MAQPARGAGAGERSGYLDVFKTMLVIGMVTAHCIQLLMRNPTPAEQVISDFINLITFSGFMLAFGIGVGLSRREKSFGQRLWPVLLLLLATYTSELAFNALVDRKALTPELLVPLFSLSRLYGWSEFLASFAVLYLLNAVARPLLVAIATQWIVLVATIALCLASTWIVVSADVPAAATIVGTTNFASFPLLAYLPWFLVGIAIGRGQRWLWWLEWGLAILGTAALAFFVYRYHDLPGRFPPTVLWVAGGALPLGIYLALARGIARLSLPDWSLAAGRRVLAALLSSNLTIFALRWWFGLRLGYPWWVPLAVAAAILAGVLVWTNLLDHLRTRRAGGARRLLPS